MVAGDDIGQKDRPGQRTHTVAGKPALDMCSLIIVAIGTGDRVVHMKDGGRGRGAKLGSKSEGGSESESSAMVVFSKVLLPQTHMEHQTKRKEESYQGMWAAAIVP